MDGLILLNIVFILLGLGMLAYGIYSFLRGREALSWPSVKGKLIYCELTSDSDDGSTTWKVEVRYTYRAAGKEHEGTRIAFGYSGSNAKSYHRNVYTRLKSVSEPTVYYQPQDPADCVLEPGFNRATLGWFVFSALWLIFTIWALTQIA